MCTHTFNDREGLRIAVEMERRGEEFYRRAARITADPQAVRVLNQLAADESAHRAEFMHMLDSLTEPGAEYDPEMCAYLTAIAADVIFPEGLVALRQVGFDDPRSVVVEAIRSEKDSILFYTGLSEASAGNTGIFGEIIKQEKGHLRILQRRLADLTSED